MTDRQPKHIKIMEIVKAEILDGTLSNPLPEMSQLGRRYGTSRLTIRNALQLLQVEGLVRIEQGAGTFITVARESSVVDMGPGQLRNAVVRYSDFLANPGFSNEIELRMIQLVDAQMDLVNDLNPSEL